MRQQHHSSRFLRHLKERLFLQMLIRLLEEACAEVWAVMAAVWEAACREVMEVILKTVMEARGSRVAEVVVWAAGQAADSAVVPAAAQEAAVKAVCHPAVLAALAHADRAGLVMAVFNF